MSVFFTAAVCVYNTEKYLRDCLDSILSQSYENIELLIIDDGSTDGSGKVCDEYAEKDSRVRVIHTETGVCFWRAGPRLKRAGRLLHILRLGRHGGPENLHAHKRRNSEKSLRHGIFRP